MEESIGYTGGFSGGAVIKNLPAKAGDIGDGARVHLFWVRKIPWNRKEMTTPSVFLPGKSHGQRRLAGYSPCGHKESESTEHSTAPYQQSREHRNVREEVPKENRKMPCSLQMKSCVGTLPSKWIYEKSRAKE